MSVNGKHVFVSQEGVQYLIDRYLTASDREELKRYNTDYTNEKFREKLINKLEKGSGGKNWIPSNYEDELIRNAGAIIGTTRTKRSLKNGREVDVYETNSGASVYEDSRGKVRDYRSGRFAKKTVFE
jgi:hypothetical protein